MAPGSRAGGPARRSIPARLLGPLQHAILSALMSSAVIILERRIRATLRRGDGTGRRTPAGRSPEPRTADHGTHPPSRGRRLSGGASKLQDSFERLMHGHAPRLSRVRQEARADKWKPGTAGHRHRWPQNWMIGVLIAGYDHAAVRARIRRVPHHHHRYELPIFDTVGDIQASAKLFSLMTSSIRQNRAPFSCVALAWPRTGSARWSGPACLG